ncbi:hypothetical protein [Oribacterium sp. P6A1]|uniref:hypothetical protein n=1 Tax=Oribacterium sp. P6A1 TaxID=1410612 RepID=UPI0005648935|nr:hypothetical protein [Oribacterium sp. P6A1]
MKKTGNINMKKTAAVIGICTLLGVASIGAIASFADVTSTTAESVQPPMNNGMYMGKITAIGSGSVTIETMGGGMKMGQGGAAMSADGTLPTNASGELETPPALPTNESGETETPPTPPTNASGEIETPPADGANGGQMGGSSTMTFTVDSTLISSFSVGDMVEITSYDGATASAVTAAQQPADMNTSTSAS